MPRPSNDATELFEQLIGSTELLKLVPLSRAHIWRLEQREEDPFPSRVKLGEGRRGKCAWWRHEVMDWLSRRAKANSSAKDRGASNDR